jgi:phenylacetate-CoA ligase
MRLGPLIGRKKQMIKYKGTTLYPPALYDILDNIENIDHYIVEVYTNEIGTDEIVIHIGSRHVPENFEKKIKDHFRAKLCVAPQIIFEPPDYIAKMSQPESGRKTIRFIDRRNHH